jgi:hypothetical protein
MDEMDRRKAALAISSDPKEWVASGLFGRYVESHNQDWPDQQIHPRSATVHLWVQDQYERDLADWERRARAHLLANPDQ